jgi:hypothetical protein
MKSVYKMADSKPIASSSSCENSALSINDSNSKKLKSSLLYLSEADLLWKGDLMLLKTFIEDELQISGRWSSTRGETIQFSNPEFCLKWHGPGEQKIAIVQDNEEKQLYAALKSYAALTESTDSETMKNFAKHVVSVVVEAEGETEKVEHKSKDKHSCGQCDSYKEEITKLLATVTEIVKKQEEDRQNNNLNDAETKAKIQTLVEHNDKMAAEIESLKANVEETTGDNKLIKHVLDIKQGEWPK